MGKNKGRFSFCNEFFHVYLSELSSCEMVIPPDFMGLLKKNQLIIPKTATLKDFKGKIWNVVLERKKKALIIKDGWTDFASYHSLVDGDFLVFKYDGVSHFDVELYGVNGLKKGKVKEGKEKENGNVVDETIQVKEDPVMEVEPIGIQPSGCAGGSGSNPRETPLIVEHDKPCFEWTMTGTSRNVHVPVSVLKAHDFKIKRGLQLRDENGKLWPVRVNFNNKRASTCITAGWSDFCRKKKLKVGDKCVFEFIIATDNCCYVMKVQVIRGRLGTETLENGKALNFKVIELVKRALSSGKPVHLYCFPGENDETGLAVERERQHSTKKKNPKGLNASNGTTSNGQEPCEDDAEWMQVVAHA